MDELYSGREVMIIVQLLSTCFLEGTCSIHLCRLSPSLACLGQLVLAEDHDERVGILLSRHVATISEENNFFPEL